jgi:hypothetical protein
LGFVYDGGIQGLTCNLVVHGYEEATKYEELFEEGRFIFPLSHHIKNHVPKAVNVFDKIFSYH